MPTGLAKQTLAARERAAVHQGGVEILTRLREDFATELEALVESTDLYGGLQARLDDVLDRAQALQPAGVSTAEDAITNGVVEQWTALRTSQGEYLTVRDAHRRLIAVTDPAIQAWDTSSNWHVLFEGVADAWPTWLEHMLGEAAMTGFTSTAGAPWPEDAKSVAHFVYVLANRDLLRPWTAAPARIRQQWTDDSLTARNAQDQDDYVSPEARAREADRRRLARLVS